MADDTRSQTTPVLKRRNRQLTPKKIDYGDPTGPLDLSNKDEDGKLHHGAAASSKPLGHLSIEKQHSTGKTDEKLVVEKPSAVYVIGDDDGDDDCVMIISDDDKDKVYPKFQEPPSLDDKLSLSKELAVSSSVGVKLSSSQVTAAVPPEVHPDPHEQEVLNAPSKETSPEELQYEAENRDRLSKICREEVFGQSGGEMTISSHSLNIPSGALISDTRITMKILQDIPDSVHLRADEVIATYAFQCLPSGLRFADGKPVKLTIPHCGNLIDPQKVQTVLYYWSHDEKERNLKAKPGRTVQTEGTCRVTPHSIDISLAHFSEVLITFIKNRSYMNGKLMSVMPFLPRTLPTSRKVMMELRMVNKPHGTSWRYIHELHENARYQPAKDDDDELVVAEEDLQLSCQTEASTPLTKKVTSAALSTTTKQTVYFDLNLEDKSDDSLVTLKLKQDKTETEIQFRTHFYDDSESEYSSSEESEYSSSEEDAADMLEGTSVRRPSGIAIDSDLSESDVDRLVDELGDHEDVEKVARKLGFRRSKWQAYRKKNKDGHLDGTRCMIFDWKKMTSKQHQRPILRKALEDAGFAEASETL